MVHWVPQLHQYSETNNHPTGAPSHEPAPNNAVGKNISNSSDRNGGENPEFQLVPILSIDEDRGLIMGKENMGYTNGI